MVKPMQDSQELYVTHPDFRLATMPIDESLMEFLRDAMVVYATPKSGSCREQQDLHQNQAVSRVPCFTIIRRLWRQRIAIAAVCTVATVVLPFRAPLPTTT